MYLNNFNSFLNNFTNFEMEFSEDIFFHVELCLMIFKSFLILCKEKDICMKVYSFLCSLIYKTQLESPFNFLTATIATKY